MKNIVQNSLYCLCVCVEQLYLSARVRIQCSQVRIQSLILTFCSCLIATVTILANDDGHGIISFNNSNHFLLREPTSVSGLGQSVATLLIVRNPPQGIFGTVTVQFSITDANGTLCTEDLTPFEGFVVLEDGVRFKVSRAALNSRIYR